MSKERVCKNCGDNYTLGVDGGRHKYCSDLCAKRYHSNKWSGPGCRDPLKMKDLRLQREFGITLEEFNGRLEEQKFKCTCCSSALSGGRDTHVDHCHRTGKVRDLLCSTCNQALGLVKERLEVLNNMIAYLRSHNAG